MATVTLPLRNDRYHYQFRISLDDTFYRFEIHYNAHDGSWYFDLRNDGETLLVGGHRIKLHADVLRYHRHLDVPQGTLQVIDTQDDDVEPDAENFGVRVIMQYVET
jgi:hypothetical protein